MSRRVCLDCGQDKLHSGRGICHACRDKRVRQGSLEERPPLGPKRSSGRRCRKCDRRMVARGLCARHYDLNRRREVAYGRWEAEPTVPSGPVREHVLALREAGMAGRAIIAATDSSPNLIWGLLRGQYAPTMLESTAQRILDTRPPANWWRHALPGTMVDPTGSMRRLRSLIALGWTQRELAKRLGVTETSISPIILGKLRFVTAGVARRVDELWREIHMTPGGSVRAVNRAKRNRWALPMQWDEDTIDDPSVRPERRRAYS